MAEPERSESLTAAAAEVGAAPAPHQNRGGAQACVEIAARIDGLAAASEWDALLSLLAGECRALEPTREALRASKIGRRVM